MINNIIRSPVPLSRDALTIDAAREATRIAAGIREVLFRVLRRKGVVVGVSGGIDSAVVAGLCTRALGAQRVLALFTPEVDSSADSLRLGKLVAQHFGIRSLTEDITQILAAAGCYRRRDEAVRDVIPEYGNGWKCKIVLPDATEARAYSIFSIIAEAPNGRCVTVRPSPEAYLGIVAATNFKQRTRKMIEYYYADYRHYAVAGTPNLLEHDLGFFVKNGDGAADLKPIAHLYKSQVYQLAEWLDVPEEIRTRPPTTDTYPLQQSQQEFYFSLRLRDLDLCLYAHDRGIAPAEVAAVLEMTVDQVKAVYASIASKRKAARYLHLNPVPVVSVNSVEGIPEHFDHRERLA